MNGKVLAFALIALRLSAHDMWIEPSDFFPMKGETVGLRLQVGQGMLGDPLPRDPALIKEFIVEDGSGRKPIGGRLGGTPAGFIRAGEPGLMVVGYRSNPSATEQPAEKFNQYLKDEGLEAVAAARARRKETGMGAKELFSRCAKSLIVSGAPRPTDGDRVLGFTMEIVAEKNPLNLRPAEALPIQVLYESKPLVGALVVAMNRLHPDQKLTARTGKDGRAKLPVSGEGMWLIKAVHMIPAAPESGAAWESFWASLTFELRPSSLEAER